MLEAAAQKGRLVGNPKPRLAPPVPARSAIKEFEATAATLGLNLYPWQVEAARYITALGTHGWLYREVAILAARQNGKSTIMVPLIVRRLLDGDKIVHTAQNRELPRLMHEQIATFVEEHYPEYLPAKRGIKYGAGMELIQFKNGGRYHIVAPTRSGARGYAADLLVIDEVLDMTDTDFISAAKPTTMASRHGQIVYFSNAGTSTSVVLQSLQDRAAEDPTLAYLEWSAGRERKVDDLDGWLEANPSIGHNPAILTNLENDYRAHLLGQTLDIWERENLCRQTLARHQAIVTSEEWAQQEFVTEAIPLRPSMAIKMDIGGERASAVLAWQEPDGRVGIDVVADVWGFPIDVDRLAPDLQKVVTQKRATIVGYDPYTDADLARLLDRAKALTGRVYASASEKFVRMTVGAQFRVRDKDGLLAEALASTIRRVGVGGNFMAVKAAPQVTNTVAEAAIRAVWLATEPRQIPRIG